MRYLTIVNSLGLGGTERCAENYSLMMKQAGHEVMAFTMNGLGERAVNLNKHGIDTILWEDKDEHIQRVIDWKPDIVHVHRVAPPFRRSNSVLERIKEGCNPAILETSVFSRADYTAPKGLFDLHLHLSPWCLWKWNCWKEALSYKAVGTSFPYAVDSEKFKPASNEDCLAFRKELGLGKDVFLFGRIGQAVDTKWSTLTVDAFRVAAERGYDCALLLIAPPPSIKAAIDQLPAQIKKRAFILDPIYDDQRLSVFYSTIDLFLHTAIIGESFGMVNAESMACETPILTRSTPAKDNTQAVMVQTNIDGWCANSDKAFIQCAVDIAKDRSQLDHRKQAARKSIQENYSFEQLQGRLDTLCKLVLQHRGNQPALVDAMHAEKFQTEVDTTEIAAYLQRNLGTMPFKEVLLTRLVHQPQLYKFYCKKKGMI